MPLLRWLRLLLGMLAMPVRDPRFPGAVLLTLLLALLLEIIPLAGWLDWLRPEWIVLTLVNWALVLRDRISLLLAFALGVLVDALHGSLLGQHAFGYVLATYLAVRLGLRMTPEAIMQQLALLFVILGLYLLASFWIENMTGGGGEGVGWLYWLPLLSSLAIWPFYRALLGYFHVQRKAM